MTGHFGLLVLFAFLTSVVFAVLQRDTPREQLRIGAWLFGGFVVSAIVAGYVMMAFPLGS
ncbi:MAG: hypothetical protein KJ061_04095 [Vicinamibacteraceae bacterium]|nr:hypothetical protein [Vicinamibacteraceae bacterium]